VVAVAADGSPQRHLLHRSFAGLAAVPVEGRFVLSPLQRGALRQVDLDGQTVRSWSWDWGPMGRPAATATRLCWFGLAPKDGQGANVAGLWLADADGQVKRCVRLPHLANST